MLGTVAAILICLLPSQVNGLITTEARCRSGYEWMFSSTGQSPCDVAAELGSVCTRSPLNVYPYIPGSSSYQYFSMTTDNQTSCTCSSVYFCLLSACAYCQTGSGASYPYWSQYTSVCLTISVTVFPRDIPYGVKVPAYAYQDVTVYNDFNIAVAQAVRGAESSGTASPTSSMSSSTSSAPTGTSVRTTNNTPVIVGGVIGGLVGLGLVVALIRFIDLRQKYQARNNNSNFEHSLNIVNNSTGQSTNPNSPNGRNFTPDIKTFTPDIMGSPISAQNYVYTGGYTGKPEL